MSDATRCAICGGDNDCVIAKRQEAAVCWCEVVRIPPQVFKDIPIDAKRTCICQRCAIKRASEASPAVREQLGRERESC